MVRFRELIGAVRSLLARRGLQRSLALLAAVSWLAASNHCTLASLNISSSLPVPSCHALRPDQKPAKQQKNANVECCKVLRARLALGKTLVIWDPSAFFVRTDFVSPIPFLLE